MNVHPFVHSRNSADMTLNFTHKEHFLALLHGQPSDALSEAVQLMREYVYQELYSLRGPQYALRYRDSYLQRLCMWYYQRGQRGWTFAHYDNFRAYVRRGTRFMYLNRFRKKEKVLGETAPVDEIDTHAPPPDFGTPQRLLEEPELMTLFEQHVLAHLDQTGRDILRLKQKTDLTDAQIGERVNRCRETVARRWTKFRKDVNKFMHWYQNHR